MINAKIKYLQQVYLNIIDGEKCIEHDFNLYNLIELYFQIDNN